MRGGGGGGRVRDAFKLKRVGLGTHEISVDVRPVSRLLGGHLLVCVDERCASVHEQQEPPCWTHTSALGKVVASALV